MSRYQLGQECEHGSLARSCELCYLQEEIALLKDEINKLTDCHNYRQNKLEKTIFDKITQFFLKGKLKMNKLATDARRYQQIRNSKSLRIDYYGEELDEWLDTNFIQNENQKMLYKIKELFFKTIYLMEPFALAVIILFGLFVSVR